MTHSGQDVSLDERLDKGVAHVYNGILLSHRKGETLPLATPWMDLEITVLIQGEDENHMTSFTRGQENKKQHTNELRRSAVVAGGEGGGGQIRVEGVKSRVEEARLGGEHTMQCT